MSESIEPGILPVCDVLNMLPGVNTKYSCEGHTVFLMRPYVMFTDPQDVALQIHRALGKGRGKDRSLKYCWWIVMHFQDDGSISYCLEPNDRRVTARHEWLFPLWWRRSMNSELIRLARLIQNA